MTDIQELKQLAEACRNAKTSDEFLKANSKYTLASHPGAILALISRIEELEHAAIAQQGAKIDKAMEG